MIRARFLGDGSVVSLLVLLAAACSSSSSGNPGDGSSGSSSGSGAGSGSTLDASVPDAGSGSGSGSGSSNQDEAGTGAEAGSDAAASGSGASTGADGATAGCGGSSALLCEDFESGAIDASTWKKSTQNGTLAVDTMHAHSGTHALHVHVSDDSGATAYITETKTFPAAGKDLFGRAMIWIDAPAPQAHVEYVGANDSTGNKSFTLGSQYATVLSLAYVGSEMGNHEDDNPLPTGQWACYEWQFDGSGGGLNVWLNGKSLTDIALVSLGSVTFASLDVGMLMFGSDGSTPAAFDAWYDDIEVGTSRIGCP